MNRNQILQVCKDEIAALRAKAQGKAYVNLLKAREDHLFAKVERDEKFLVFEIGKRKAFGLSTQNLKEELSKIEGRKKEALSFIGLTLEDLEPQYSCKVCNDLGYTNTGLCSCLKNKMNEMITKECGAEHTSLNDFSNFNAEIAKSDTHKKQLLQLKKKFEIIAHDFPNNVPKFILLSGTTGVGKTFLTECLAKELIDKNYLVSFISAFGMNNMFLSYHTTNGNEQKNAYLNALIDPDCLIIDDLGTEPMLKNVTREYLYLILSERSRANKMTIITTNLAPNELLARYNERIFSRLFNKREGFAVQINGTDLRLAKDKKEDTE